MSPGAPPRRLPLVAAWTGLSLLANGYVFALADHGIHLPFGDMVLSADRWRGDLLLDAFAHHHSFLWHLQAPFAALLGLPAWALLLHVTALFATGLALHLLAERLSDRPWAPALALLLLALGQPALGGADTLDPLLLNRGVALPLELAALWLMLRGRGAAAFALLGVAAWIHVPSAAALAFGMAVAWSMTSDGWRARAAPLLCAVTVSPLLARWLLAGEPGAGWRVDAAWGAILEARLGHHLSPSTWPLRSWTAASGWLALAVVACWRATEALRPVAWVVAGLVAWALLAGGVGGSALGLALGLQLEPWQAWRFVVVLAAVAGAGWLASPTGRAGQAGRAGVAALFASGHAPLALPALGLALLVDGRGGAPVRPPRWLVWPAVVLLLWGAGRWKADGGERSRLLPTGERTEEADVADWLREHSPEGSLVAVPPHRFESERWRAQRPVFVTWKDGGEALFDRGVALEWQRRIELACACRPLDEPLSTTRGPGARLAELRRRLEVGLLEADPDALAAALRSEGVDLLVLPATVPSPGAVLHRTQNYTVSGVDQ